MKKLLLISALFLMGIAITINGCRVKPANKPDEVKTMDDLIVSPNFDWSTTKTVMVFITLPSEFPNELIRLYSADNEQIFYSGYGDRNTETLATAITIPSSVNMIKVVYGTTGRYKPVLVGVEDDLVYNFNDFKKSRGDGCDLTGFITYSQGGWSSPAHGNNPGTTRDAYFSEVFPNGLTAGDPTNFTIKLTTSGNAKNFLPGGGNSKVLTHSYVNPLKKDKVAGNWGGQIVAAIMNVEYDRAGHMGTNSKKLADLVFASGPFEGMTVDAFLVIANKALGGGGLSGYSINDIQSYAEIIDINFDNGADLGYLTCADNGGSDQCGCKKGLRSLTMEYNGTGPDVVQVIEKKNNVVIYNGVLNSGDQFTFYGSGNDNKMDNTIYFIVNGTQDASMHTSCSVDIFKGDIYGSFTVVDGTSENDLHLCEGGADQCGCDDNINYLKLRYTGTATAHIKVKEKKHNHKIFDGFVDADNTFSFTGSGKKGSMGEYIKVYVNNTLNTTIYTDCSNSMEVGDTYGDFTVVEGTSKNNLPLCGTDNGGGGGGGNNGGGGGTNDNFNGTLAFEDLWPGKGDYDFNDLVINYDFDVTKDAQNLVQNITATFTIYAYGASYHNAFGFTLPNVNPDQIISATGYDIAQGSIYNITSNGTEAGQSKATFIVYDDSWRVMPPIDPGIGVNTEPDKAYVDSVTIVMQLSFYENGSFAQGGSVSYDDLDIGNFNPFIVVDQIRGLEVHLPNHAPSDLADPDYFGTMEDNSIPADGRYYKTSNNLPWCINIPTIFNYPIEKADITGAHLHFGEWAESDGQLYPDWYENKSGYRNDALIYQKPE